MNKMLTGPALFGAVAPLLALACSTSFDPRSDPSSAPHAETCTVTLPPASAPDVPATNGARHVYAMTKLAFGDKDGAGNAALNGWKQYGRNIDGKASTRDSTDLCKLAKGAARSNQIDGCSGIDNSFGVNLLPLFLTTVGQDATEKLNASLADGSLTNLVSIDGLDGTRDVSGLRGFIEIGAARAADGTTWAVTSDSLVGASAPRLFIANGFVRGGVLVAELVSNAGRVTLGELVVKDRWRAVLTFTVSRLWITAAISDDGTKLTNGILAGVFPAESFVDDAKRIYCAEPDSRYVADMVGQSADILADGTQDPARDCNGISFGIGFEASLASTGDVVEPVTTSSGCYDTLSADGGAPDGAGDARSN
jgi:hypothetical protein